jgi:predicted TIM-barrel fold metal-dependent hydrolase
MILADWKLFDAHLHIIDGRFPLVPNNGFIPDEFTCDDYRRRMQDYDLQGGAVVSGSFQAFDQGYLVEALKQLGPGFVGVTQLPATVTDAELVELNDQGVRALRFNLKRGGSEEVHHLRDMARRVYELAGWHIELYVDSGDLRALYPTLSTLPTLVIDHLGLSSAGFSDVLKLAEQGARVKATGFSRGDLDIRTALRDLTLANPDSLMFGTDLPSTRAPRAYSEEDFRLVVETLGEAQARRVFYDNAVSFYRP